MWWRWCFSLMRNPSGEKELSFLWVVVQKFLLCYLARIGSVLLPAIKRVSYLLLISFKSLGYTVFFWLDHPCFRTLHSCGSCGSTPIICDCFPSIWTQYVAFLWMLFCEWSDGTVTIFVLFNNFVLVKLLMQFKHI